MKVLVIGPSDTGSCGGMAEVIHGIRESELLNHEFEIGIFPSYIDGSIPIRLLYSAYRYFRFLRVYKKYDLFHIHTAEKGSTFRKSLYLRKIKKAGKKAILHIHGAEYLVFYDGLGRCGKRIADRLFHQADLVLALSESWKQELEARFHIDTCRVLYNGVDTAQFRSAASNVSEHCNSFLMLGRLGARKGAYDLIDAAELAVWKNPGLTVCMAGDGEVGQIRTLIAEKGLKQHIQVPGWIGRDEKLNYLKNASVVILPSYHEGLPVSILEGMAAGKAIISTTVGAIPEVITEKNGILVESGDTAALAEAMLRCSSDIEMLDKMSQNNIEKAEHTFSIRKMHEHLSEYYRQVMNCD